MFFYKSFFFFSKNKENKHIKKQIIYKWLFFSYVWNRKIEFEEGIKNKTVCERFYVKYHSTPLLLTINHEFILQKQYKKHNNIVAFKPYDYNNGNCTTPTLYKRWSKCIYIKVFYNVQKMFLRWRSLSRNYDDQDWLCFQNFLAQKIIYPKI